MKKQVHSNRIYVDGETIAFSEFLKINMADYICYSFDEPIGNVGVWNIFFVERIPKSYTTPIEVLYDQLIELDYNIGLIMRDQIKEDIEFSSEFEILHNKKVYVPEYFEYVEYTDVWAGTGSWEVNNLTAPEYGYFIILKDTDLWMNSESDEILKKFVRENSIFSNIFPEHELTEVDYDGTYHVIQRKHDIPEDLEQDENGTDKEYWENCYPLGRIHFSSENEFHY